MAIDPLSSSAHRRPEPLAPEATVDLLNRIKDGDNAALERLLQRCIPALCRWAHGRLPGSALSLLETPDLVQDTVVAALRRIDAFDMRHQGALQAYLRQAVMNRIRDRVRRRPPDETALTAPLADEGTSPLDRAVGSENVARYDVAIHRLTPADREAVIGRIELQYSYDELAVTLDQPTPAAARLAVTRAMRRLADEMRHAG
jgi:RNA polymerase sigma-70 factor (ECF subfamily)